jgi:hypothetical protein
MSAAASVAGTAAAAAAGGEDDAGAVLERVGWTADRAHEVESMASRATGGPQVRNADAVRDVSKLLTDVAKEVLGSQAFQLSDVVAHSNLIANAGLRVVKAFIPGHKVLVSCAIMEKRGANYHSSTCCLWDATNDGSFVVKVDTDNLVCTLTVFALAF